MSSDPGNDDGEGVSRPGAVIVRPDRPLGKLRKGQGRARNLLVAREARQVQPAPPPELPEPAAPPEPALPAMPPGGSAMQYSQVLLDLQRTRKRRFFLRLALFVGLPTVLVFLYTFWLATPRYVAEFQVTYQNYQPAKSLSVGLVESIVGSNNSGSVDIGTIIYEYVQSPALLTKLDSTLHLKQYYSDPGIDWFSRLSSSASSEKFLSYYHRRVAVSEGLGGYLTIDVTAFDPKYAVALAKAIVQACDAMVDGMTARARQEEVRAAEAELTREEQRVRQARKALTDFQNVHGDLDPQRVASQLGQIVGNLESQLSTARTELANTLAYMRPDAPRVVQLKFLISALEQQLRQEQSRLANNSGTMAGSHGGVPYSQILDEYNALQLEADFAQKAYLAAQQGLTVARADAARQQSYLIAFAPPNEPDRATQWFPVTYTLATFLIAVLAFGIGSLLFGALRDQTGI
jgi:capsular polysaccharide transport system permease protein